MSVFDRQLGRATQPLAENRRRAGVHRGSHVAEAMWLASDRAGRASSQVSIVWDEPICVVPEHEPFLAGLSHRRRGASYAS